MLQFLSFAALRQLIRVGSTRDKGLFTLLLRSGAYTMHLQCKLYGLKLRILTFRRSFVGSYDDAGTFAAIDGANGKTIWSVGK